jgi:hypothetical protein
MAVDVPFQGFKPFRRIRLGNTNRINPKCFHNRLAGFMLKYTSSFDRSGKSWPRLIRNVSLAVEKCAFLLNAWTPNIRDAMELQVRYTSDIMRACYPPQSSKDFFISDLLLSICNGNNEM